MVVNEVSATEDGCTAAKRSEPRDIRSDACVDGDGYSVLERRMRNVIVYVSIIVGGGAPELCWKSGLQRHAACLDQVCCLIRVS